MRYTERFYGEPISGQIGRERGVNTGGAYLGGYTEGSVDGRGSLLALYQQDIGEVNSPPLRSRAADEILLRMPVAETRPPAV